MNIQNYYSQLELLLRKRRPEEAADMLAFLKDLAQESEDEELYLHALGTPEEVADMFCSRHAFFYDSDMPSDETQLPPIPPLQKESDPRTRSSRPQNIQESDAHPWYEDSRSAFQNSSESFSEPDSDMSDLICTEEGLQKMQIHLISADIFLYSGNTDTYALHVLEGAELLEVKEKKHSLSIEQNSPFPFLLKKKKVILEIELPRKVLKRASIELVNGSIRWQEGCVRRCSLSTVNGTIALSNSYFQKLDLSGINGTIEMQTTGSRNMHLSSVNGKVIMNDCFFEKGDCDTVTGPMEIALRPAMKMKVETGFGTIQPYGFPETCLHQKPYEPGSRFTYVPESAQGFLKVSLLKGTAVLYHPDVQL